MGFRRLFRSGKASKNRDEPVATSEPSSGEKAQEVANEPLDRASPPSLPPPADLRFERDNRARRLLREPLARTFLESHRRRQDPSPLLRYAFATDGEALSALASLDCVHFARDTGNLICTADLTLGFYRRPDGRYEVLLAGHGLEGRLWSEARSSFSAHGGRRQDERTPSSRPTDRGPLGTAQRVTFVREFYEMDLSGAGRRCQLYRAGSAVAARAFLADRDTRVAPRRHEIVVETPDGRFVKDSGGIREEKD